MEASSPLSSRSEPFPADQRNPSPSSGGASISSSLPLWPTVDGPLGLTEDDSVAYARKFYRFGFALLPWFWAVNCFYFWPVLSNPRSFPQIRPYIIRSAFGFSVFTALLCTWALTFSLGGERLFGSTWDQLLMYNLANKWGLTGWD
ncbi:hypothetical protein MLD38_017726 [Melastoma candidum]|uniref:Uncharacterized protein n=1 Tax=Melastoma candidum TaxID=119954 RepID=A0ACB9QTH4_9MYRT|nr:hypothetical protein MLD38_017726 [Melastoma candidum]